MNSIVEQLQQGSHFLLNKNLKIAVYQDVNEFNCIKKAAHEINSWFESREIDRMLELVFSNYLDENKLFKWLKSYNFNKSNRVKTVGIVAAGNIPLASFQDVLCSLACGFKIKLKLSSKDQVLSRFIYEKINSLLPNVNSNIEFVDKLTDIDAIITSGNNLTANHFKKYAQRFPCLIRAHRNSIAILSGQETDQELIALGHDVFSFYGLGCRNVTKVYVPEKSMIFRLAKLFDEHFAYVRDNSRYNNNYDYQLAILSLNRNIFYQGHSVFFNENDALNSSISVLNYQVYNSLLEIERELLIKKEYIQCITTNIDRFTMATSNLGKAQWPELWDYQDGVDVIHFLQG